MFQTDIEGLTGNISFNEEGHRYNFTLQVVEMTVQSAMLKVGGQSLMSQLLQLFIVAIF